LPAGQTTATCEATAYATGNPPVFLPGSDGMATGPATFSQTAVANGANGPTGGLNLNGGATPANGNALAPFSTAAASLTVAAEGALPLAYPGSTAAFQTEITTQLTGWSVKYGNAYFVDRPNQYPSTDCNGALFASNSLADTAAQVSGTTVTPYTLTLTQAGENILSPQLNIQSWIDLSGGNNDNTVTLAANGATTIAQAIQAAGTNVHYACGAGQFATSTFGIGAQPTNCGGATLDGVFTCLAAFVAGQCLTQTAYNGGNSIPAGGVAVTTNDGAVGPGTLNAMVFHGFTAGQSITLTLPDNSIAPITSIGFGGVNNLISVAGVATYVPTQAMILGAGSYTISAKDSAGAPQSATFVNAITMTPVVTTDSFGPAPGPFFTSALTSTAGQPGQTTVLRSGTDSTSNNVYDFFGVRNLAPNTQYTVAMGYINPVTLGTFTTDAFGDIPVPGITLTIPSATAGIHIISLWQGTTNTLLAASSAPSPTLNGVAFATYQAYNTVSFVNAQGVAGTDGATENVAAGACIAAGNPAGCAATATSALGTQAGAVNAISLYGDDLYSVTVLINPSPSAGNVGQTVSLSGVGLAPSSSYYATMTAVNNGAGATGQVYFTFTSTASGSIPTGTSFTVPVLAATGAAYTNERASTYFIHFSTGTEYPGKQDGQATFVLQAAAVLNATSVAAGHSVTLTATGLFPNTPYSVVFNYQVNTSGQVFTGPVVASVTSNNNGQGSANFVVPAGTQAGSYVIQLVTPGAIAPTAAWLVNAPTLSVTPTGTGTGAGACNSTACFTQSGAASQVTLGSNQAVSVSYTNTSNSPVTAIVYAVVHNSIGQTVLYSTATLPLAAGATGTGYPIIFGLPSGTYSVTVFATTTNGQAISTTSTVSVSF